MANRTGCPTAKKCYCTNTTYRHPQRHIPRRVTVTLVYSLLKPPFKTEKYTNRLHQVFINKGNSIKSVQNESIRIKQLDENERYKYVGFDRHLFKNNKFKN